MWQSQSWLPVNSNVAKPVLLSQCGKAPVLDYLSTPMWQSPSPTLPMWQSPSPTYTRSQCCRLYNNRWSQRTFYGVWATDWTKWMFDNRKWRNRKVEFQNLANEKYCKWKILQMTAQTWTCQQTTAQTCQQMKCILKLSFFLFFFFFFFFLQMSAQKMNLSANDSTNMTLSANDSKNISANDSTNIQK